MKAAQDRQKSYANRRRRDLEFDVGDHVFLRVMPMRGVRRFGVSGVLVEEAASRFQPQGVYSSAMATHLSWFLLGLLVLAAANAEYLVSDKFNRSSFPEGFLFGASSSAYQYEGSPGTRGDTIWEAFVRDFPYKIADRSNANVTDDFLKHYKEDVKLMKDIGMNVFRFSISWARVLPSKFLFNKPSEYRWSDEQYAGVNLEGGGVSGGVNKTRVDFYKSLIDELLANDTHIGIQPFVTLFHFDLPQALEKECEGFLNPNITDDFKDYAEFCFKEFGGKVKHWITFNEPYVYILMGYDLGDMAPGRCSAWRINNCPDGNSSTEPYIVGHNMLIAHAKAAKVYMEEYQESQKGEIGITLAVGWMYPYSKKFADKKAANRALDFMYGWFIHPLVYGDYPRIMKDHVRDRLPKFNDSEATLLIGSYDFIALNYYSSNYAVHVPRHHKPAHLSFSTDDLAILTSEKDGKPIGKPLGNTYKVPEGLKKILNYTKNHYKSPRMYITENGLGDSNEIIEEDTNNPEKTCIKDPERIEYYRAHLSALKEAIDDGVDVKGFMAWSLLDTWEWSSGFTLRYGLIYVDYQNEVKRCLKKSAAWYKKFLLH
ncbi:beta-glucosidase 13-like [Diospyros lotus]|uniref:beta-glucosidase 13-like n=1 Tax=Diospyros lotus TaxID=55363 RepID=UPI002252B4DF|nr:beta-glucosidase 13-like [Diospyros lotus]